MQVLLVLPGERRRLEIESALKAADFEVSVALEQHHALKLMNEENPQVIIVEGAIPDLDAILLCKDVRMEMGLPETIIICLREAPSGTEIPPDPRIGIDAELQRPFTMEELISKVVQLQSGQTLNTNQGVLTAGAIRMDPERWLVFVAGDAVDLTEKEYRLLQELMEVKGRVLTRETLLERVWGYQKSYKLETRTLDVHMSRLRSKLGQSASNIITVRNVGYRMNVVPEWLRH